MLKAILVDDDIRDIEIMEMMLDRYCTGDISIAGKAHDIGAAYLQILETKPDIVFLDIELGAESGFDLLTKFSEFTFRVIFVTAYSGYAIRAIRFNALDYILKPVIIEELVNAVQKLKHAAHGATREELKNLVHFITHPDQLPKQLAIPVLSGYQMLPVHEILYCEAKKEYTHIYNTSQPPLCSCINLGEYEELLEEFDFCRVHHSFLVNKMHVKQYIRGEGGELILADGNVIPVSRRKRHTVIEWLTTLGLRQ